MKKNSESAEQRIRNFVENHLLTGKSVLSPEDSLLISGQLDSVAHLRLVSFLEKTFDITVDIDDYDPENFDSLVKITAFVRRKLTRATGC